jgi:peroxiredoxin
MLKAMEYNGAIGHTGKISIIADGDGDFNPKFVFDENLPHDDIPLKSTKEEIIFDAG